MVIERLHNKESEDSGYGSDNQEATQILRSQHLQLNRRREKGGNAFSHILWDQPSPNFLAHPIPV